MPYTFLMKHVQGWCTFMAWHKQVHGNDQGKVSQLRYKRWLRRQLNQADFVIIRSGAASERVDIDTDSD